MSDNAHRPILWSTIEEYEGDPEVLARQGGGDWNTKPAGFAAALESLGIPEISMRRRTFLKMSGFAAVLAAAAGCEKPAEKILPYVTAPDEIVPGVPNFYASTCGGCSAGCGLIVKTYEARPIKLEGNPNHPVNKGKLCARGQASLVDLYDPDRARGPVVVKNGTSLAWEQADAQVAEALRKAGGRAVLLTGTMHGPGRMAALEGFKKAFPGLRHVVYDAFSDADAAEARGMLLGDRSVPRYHFDKADVTVLLGSDPMAEGPSSTESMAGIGLSRKIREENGRKTMGRLYAFEPTPTMSGINADHRHSVRPSDLAPIAIAIAAQLQKDGHSEVPGVPSITVNVESIESKAGLPKGMVAKVAGDLWAHRGKAVVHAGGVMGRNGKGVELHLAVTLINLMIGAEGTIVDASRPANHAQGSAAAMAALLEDMRQGRVDVLLVHGTNPAYSLPAGADFAGAMAKVKTKVSFSTHLDETALLCDHLLPDVHYLENWGDAEPYAGFVSLRQPVIGKLWDNRAFEESLMLLARAGGSKDFDLTIPAAKEGEAPVVRAMTWHELLRATWEENIYKAGGFAAATFQDFWFEALRQGVLELPAPAAQAPQVSAAAAAQRLSGFKAADAPELELAVYPMVNTGDGRHANNPWLLELPDPVSKVCWDNYVVLAPATARERKLKDGDIVEITANGTTVRGPVRRQPGMHRNVVAVGTGWGRTAAGAVGNGEGFNAFALGAVKDGNVSCSGAAATLEKTGESIPLADVQGHNYMKKNPLDEDEYNRPIVQATSLELFNKNEESPQSVHHIPYWKKGEKKPDIWRTEDFPYTRHKWVMTIDLNSCTSCNACMVACQAENNIPVVGKREVLVGREMHWIRIDRYYKGDLEDPEFVKGPMLCQHCDNAPCETVCPVLATVHSDDGINQQVYNRCVGTRYCANNCPYKVRRFNFYNYSKFRKGPHDELEAGAEGRVAETPLALALNPEVTVRGKGIMEKCSFCQQRIRTARDEAKKLGRNIPNGALQTACQQTCPSQAITFGDALNEEHDVVRIREANAGRRGYGILEETNVKPNIMYLAQIWNRETKPFDVDYEKEYSKGKHKDHGDAHDDHGGDGKDAHGEGADANHHSQAVTTPAGRTDT